MVLAKVIDKQLAFFEDGNGKVVWASTPMVKTGMVEKGSVGRPVEEVFGAEVARALNHQPTLPKGPARATIAGKVYQVQSNRVDKYKVRVFTQVA
jgi:hypothetical protein